MSLFRKFITDVKFSLSNQELVVFDLVRSNFIVLWFIIKSVDTCKCQPTPAIKPAGTWPSYKYTQCIMIHTRSNVIHLLRINYGMLQTHKACNFFLPHRAGGVATSTVNVT